MEFLQQKTSFTRKKFSDHLIPTFLNTNKMEKQRQRVTDEQLKECIPDLPRGQLDNYRKKASFDWRRMKLAYETLNTIKFKVSYFLLYKSVLYICNILRIYIF